MSFEMFNAFEAIVWFCVAAAALILRNQTQGKFYPLAVYASIVFALFGLSDVVEIYSGSFLEPKVMWLLVWKIINTTAIVIGLVWYITLRHSYKNE